MGSREVCGHSRRRRPGPSGLFSGQNSDSGDFLVGRQIQMFCKFGIFPLALWVLLMLARGAEVRSTFQPACLLHSSYRLSRYTTPIFYARPFFAAQRVPLSVRVYLALRLRRATSPDLSGRDPTAGAAAAVRFAVLAKDLELSPQLPRKKESTKKG